MYIALILIILICENGIYGVLFKGCKFKGYPEDHTFKPNEKFKITCIFDDYYNIANIELTGNSCALLNITVDVKLHMDNTSYAITTYIPKTNRDYNRCIDKYNIYTATFFRVFSPRPDRKQPLGYAKNIEMSFQINEPFKVLDLMVHGRLIDLRKIKEVSNKENMFKHVKTFNGHTEFEKFYFMDKKIQFNMAPDNYLFLKDMTRPGHPITLNLTLDTYLVMHTVVIFSGRAFSWPRGFLQLSTSNSSSWSMICHDYNKDRDTMMIRCANNKPVDVVDIALVPSVSDSLGNGIDEIVLHAATIAVEKVNVISPAKHFIKQITKYKYILGIVIMGIIAFMVMLIAMLTVDVVSSPNNIKDMQDEMRTYTILNNMSQSQRIASINGLQIMPSIRSNQSTEMFNKDMHGK